MGQFGEAQKLQRLAANSTLRIFGTVQRQDCTEVEQRLVNTTTRRQIGEACYNLPWVRSEPPKLTQTRCQLPTRAGSLSYVAGRPRPPPYGPARSRKTT